jgi:hypothetical protein
MASKGLRAISCQVTRKVGAGYNPSHTTETLIGYTVCYRLVFFVFSHFSFNLLHRFCLLCVGFGGSFAIFGLSVGLCELQMCHQMRWLN